MQPCFLQKDRLQIVQMNSDGKFFIGVLAAVVLVIGGVIIYNSRHSASVSSSAINVTDGQMRGPVDAKVKIVEFGDFQCPACGAAEPELRKALKNNPDVELIFKNFPLPQHANAEKAHRAAEAAAKQNKFWEMHDMLYDRQQDWAELSDPSDTFTGYATAIGLELNTFKNDYSSSSIVTNIDRDKSYGLALGVNQTPTFYINNKQVIGAQTANQWQSLIDAAKK